jgi:Flp pilus assembly protein TadD
MGDRFGAALALRTLGELDLAEGRYSEAGTRLEEYLRQCAELGLPLWRARGLRDLAAVLATTGRTEQADAALAEAIGVFRAYGAREYDELRRRPEALLKSS